jgi:hypothetical protein
MATHAITKYRIERFWDDEFKTLNYIHEPFNDPVSLSRWTAQGYTGPFTGFMCDMRRPQPSWNNKIVSLFEEHGWRDVGTSYYRMDTGVVLPTHQDLYVKYIDIFGLKGKEKSIRRAIVFLEDWASGHYFEIMDNPLIMWTAGQVVEWSYDTPHMAANLGSTPRYTLQITGHL